MLTNMIMIWYCGTHLLHSAHETCPFDLLCSSSTSESGFLVGLRVGFSVGLSVDIVRVEGYSRLFKLSSISKKWRILPKKQQSVRSAQGWIEWGRKRWRDWNQVLRCWLRLSLVAKLKFWDCRGLICWELSQVYNPSYSHRVMSQLLQHRRPSSKHWQTPDADFALTLQFPSL